MNDSSKILLIFLLGLGMGLGGYWIYDQSLVPEPVEISPISQSDTSISDMVDDQSTEKKIGIFAPLSDWELFTYNDYNLSLKYPPSMEMISEGLGGYKFTYIGPDAQPNTEITDGIYFMLIPETVEESGTVINEEFISKEYQGVSNLTTMKKGQEMIYLFKAESVIPDNPINHVIIPRESNSYIDITYRVSGSESDQGDYQAVVDEMIKSLDLK